MLLRSTRTNLSDLIIWGNKPQLEANCKRLQKSSLTYCALPAPTKHSTLFENSMIEVQILDGPDQQCSHYEEPCIC